MKKNKSIQQSIKRIIDFLVSLSVLIVLFPIFLIIAILIKLDSKGRVLFVHERVGENGIKFKFYKFRTMAEDAPDTGIEDITEKDPRITKIGKFLREWTIDEFPQFINILKGDMSLVGPRPMPEYKGENEKLKKLWQKRLLRKPGLVSLVDIKGRALVPWEKRFEYDNWYIDNWSLRLDFKILILGFFVVLSRKGVYGEQGGPNS
ncbi:MAG: sugar transferase [Patescibacteria group bacterium]